MEFPHDRPHHPRRRYPSDARDGDQREKLTHMFRDIGPAVTDPDFRPRTYGDPHR